MCVQEEAARTLGNENEASGGGAGRGGIGDVRRSGLESLVHHQEGHKRQPGGNLAARGSSPRPLTQRQHGAPRRDGLCDPVATGPCLCAALFQDCLPQITQLETSVPHLHYQQPDTTPAVLM